ncbi:MAG: hypothetical protein ACI90V_002619, partial [Bacillariaceae sp.]|jgi:hypothetical protein
VCIKELTYINNVKIMLQGYNVNGVTIVYKCLIIDH